MKTSTKIKTFIIIFFVAIAVIITARHFVGLHFKKKFSVRPAPGVIVEAVTKKNFYDSIETFGTAIALNSKTYRVKKEEIEGSLPSEWDQKPDFATIHFPFACEGAAGFAMHALETGIIEIEEAVRFMHSLEGKILKEKMLDAGRIDEIINECNVSESQKSKLHAALREHRSANKQ